MPPLSTALLPTQRIHVGRQGTTDYYLIVDPSKERHEIVDSGDFGKFISVKAHMRLVTVGRWHRIVGVLAAAYAIAKAAR